MIKYNIWIDGYHKNHLPKLLATNIQANSFLEACNKYFLDQCENDHKYSYLSPQKDAIFLDGRKLSWEGSVFIAKLIQLYPGSHDYVYKYYENELMEDSKTYLS